MADSTQARDSLGSFVNTIDVPGIENATKNDRRLYGPTSGEIDAAVKSKRQVLQHFIDENTISTIPKDELEKWWKDNIVRLGLSYYQQTDKYYSTSGPYKLLLQQARAKLTEKFKGGLRRKLSKRKSRKSIQYRKKSYRKHKKTMKSK
jgi:hypothetical protein